MGQNPSKVDNNQPATKPPSALKDLKRVSRLFQPGLKRDQRIASGSNKPSSPPSKVEDATTDHLAGGEPEAESRPAEGTENQV